MMDEPLRIGYVPEHFSTPLYFAQEYFGLSATLVAFPSGTGHMITSLRAKEIDVAIGLTEGWIAGLGNKNNESTGELIKSEAGYSLVGTYVETKLRWAISTGINRQDIKDVSDLRGHKLGVSRMGSGSHIMGFVLADQRQWLTSGIAPFSLHPLQTFAKLREGVNDKTIDFFMWEYFTSKRYYSEYATPHPIKQIGDIHTPWPSWHIVAVDPEDHRLTDLFSKLDQGISYFETHLDEAVSYISTHLDYSEEDARSWLKTVMFTRQTRGVDRQVVVDTIGVLQKAGILAVGGHQDSNMIGVERST